MRNFRRRSGKTLRRQVRVDNPPLDQLPQAIWAKYNSFKGGYDASDLDEDTPVTSSPYALNTEVTRNDRIIRAPGTTPVETFAARDVVQMVLQPSLDNRSELLFFAPPFLGVKSVGPTVFTDFGLPSAVKHLYAWANYGGTLIFSNGLDKVYAREPRSSPEEIIGGPIAGTYASFAGRVFAGNTTLFGRKEPLGLAWTSAAGDYEDWSGTASGYELLINEMSTGDRIQALRPMGLDWLAIICRKSIWIGRRTGIAERPADFQPRVPGAGAINEAVCQITPIGVLLLGDDGVRAFDGNQAPVISHQINPDLLPIDFDNLNAYSSSYNPVTKRYYLYTPTDTWILDIEFQRWYRRSLVARGGTIFAEQFPALTWAELAGTWGDQGNLRWSDYSPEESPNVDMLFLTKVGADSLLAMEDVASENFFGVAMASPVWELPVKQGEGSDTDVWSIKNLLLRYSGAGTISIQLPNMDGSWDTITTQLLTAADLRRVLLPVLHSGVGFGARLVWGAGAVEISRVGLQIQYRGPRVETALENPRQIFPDF